MKEIIISKLECWDLIKISLLEGHETSVISNIQFSRSNEENKFCQNKFFNFNENYILQFLQGYFNQAGFMTVMTITHWNENELDGISMTIVKNNEMGIDFMPDWLKERLREQEVSHQVLTYKIES